jgi:hypothetical protein
MLDKMIHPLVALIHVDTSNQNICKAAVDQNTNMKTFNSVFISTSSI